MTEEQFIALNVARELIGHSMDVGGLDMPPNSSWVSLDDLMQRVMVVLPVEPKQKKACAHAALSWLVSNKFLDTTRGQVFLYGAD